MNIGLNNLTNWLIGEIELGDENNRYMVVHPSMSQSQDSLFTTIDELTKEGWHPLKHGVNSIAFANSNKLITFNHTKNGLTLSPTNESFVNATYINRVFCVGLSADALSAILALNSPNRDVIVL